MSRSFNPARLGVNARSLYTLLADGQAHPIDEARMVIVDNIPMDVAARYKSNQTEGSDASRRMAHGRKEAARIAIHVAVRDGWVTRDGDMLTMTEDARRIWLESGVAS